MGEGTGVATIPRAMSSRSLGAARPDSSEFDQNGTFVKEFGVGSYGFAFAHGPRGQGRQRLGGRRGHERHSEIQPRRQTADGARRRRSPSRRPCCPAAASIRREPAVRFHRPTDISWDPQGNIFISDGYGDSRVVKPTRMAGS